MSLLVQKNPSQTDTSGSRKVPTLDFKCALVTITSVTLNKQAKKKYWHIYISLQIRIGKILFHVETRQGSQPSIEAALKSATFINTNNCDTQRQNQDTDTSHGHSVSNNTLSLVCLCINVILQNVRRKRSTVKPWATGNMGGFWRTKSTVDTRVKLQNIIWGVLTRSPKAQKKKSANKESEMKH